MNKDLESKIETVVLENPDITVDALSEKIVDILKNESYHFLMSKSESEFRDDLQKILDKARKKS